MPAILRSMRLLLTDSDSRPSTSASTTALNVYRAVPTPLTITTIVSSFSPVPKSPSSRNPTVVTVVTVW